MAKRNLKGHFPILVDGQLACMKKNCNWTYPGFGVDAQTSFDEHIADAKHAKPQKGNTEDSEDPRLEKRRAATWAADNAEQ